MGYGITPPASVLLPALIKIGGAKIIIADVIADVAGSPCKFCRHISDPPSATSGKWDRVCANVLESRRLISVS